MGLTEEQMAERDESLMQLKITTYKDKKGYVFVSYKSDDWKKVFEEKIFQLQDMGLRIYSDKNFNDTNHPWLDDMDKNIKYSSAVVLFISCEYLKSYATLIELLTAIKYKKDIVPIYFSSKNSLFDELKDDVELEDDIIKMEPSEAKRLESLMQMNDGKYMESVKKIWNECSDKFSAQKFSVMNVVDAFEKILCENGLKDNLFGTNNESLINTINDACSGAKHSDVFDLVGQKKESVMVSSKGEVNSVTENRTIDNSVELKALYLSDESQFEDSNPKKKSASVTGDITYTLYGKEYTDNQANMMLRIFAQVLNRHQDKVATLPEQAGMNCAMKYEDIKNPNESNGYPTYFRSCHNFEFSNGESVCIGTAYSSGDKMKKIARLLDICGEDRSIFSSEQIEIPAVKVSKRAAENGTTTNNGGIHYSVYGESFRGDQTDMMTTICSKIIEKHLDKLQAVIDGTLCVGYNDATTMAKTYFRVYREFSCNGVDYVIGTSFGLAGKIKEIEKVIAICGEDVKNIEIENIELGEKEHARKAKVKQNFLED